MGMDNYDSRNDTLKHIRRVQELLNDVAALLIERGRVHDVSKLESPEKEVFDEVTPELRSLTYGSEEYKASLAKMGKALEHHYINNSHHPEHFALYTCPTCQQQYTRRTAPAPDYENYRWCIACHDGIYPGYFETALIETPGIGGMSLLDLIEMFCDWKAATERHDDGSIEKSITHNSERFEIAPQLQSVLRNTMKELGY